MYRFILHLHHKRNIIHYGYETLQFKPDNEESTQLV